ncbi:MULTISPECIES: hypothetical protein [unclassified Streptomyces]|uniref:hypothetical protein n=1 Tax=unclassified Streptomyces TaxID=2593676 RepID=UPI00278BF6A6|nr:MULTISPECIES: hypothetical protein [unclassified Streptomyces]
MRTTAGSSGWTRHRDLEAIRREARIAVQRSSEMRKRAQVMRDRARQMSDRNVTSLDLVRLRADEGGQERTAEVRSQ